MRNRWSESELLELVSTYPGLPRELAAKIYSSRLLAQEPSLILHGGGNTSIKAQGQNFFGEPLECLYVKASGFDLLSLTPEGIPALDLAALQRYQQVEGMDDQRMTNELRRHLLDPQAANPSIEALVHAFIPAKSVDHTHADAILTLCCQEGGKALLEVTLPGFVVVDYVEAGFPLAKAVQKALAANPKAKGLVLAWHGIITWGATAKESYDLMIEAVGLAEAKIKSLTQKPLPEASPEELEEAHKRLRWLSPLLRGLLSSVSGGKRWVLLPLIEAPVLGLVNRHLEALVSGPLTPDHLIRTKALPMALSDLDVVDPTLAKVRIKEALERYQKEYEAYYDRQVGRLDEKLDRFDSLPRMILVPGIGAIAVGPNARHGQIALDILRQTLVTKGQILGLGKTFKGLSEDHLFDMEYRGLQHYKLRHQTHLPMVGRVALVTGAAGAIGSGICHELAQEGAQVIFTDLAGENLERVGQMFLAQYPTQVFCHPMDVTSEASIQACFDAVISRYGGLDLLVINAGLAYVSKLEEMELARFQLLERVNVEGTLLMLKLGAKHLKNQGCGGDIVLVSTKNVFSPSASFGAYSATKAGAHQLARIASLELADADIRVNMVSPDGVFSDDDKVKSGLWATVGPDRMKARGLDEKGLERYYQDRNLLKARVTARHVGKAVLFFATRQTPTTGATIPVDGGLPDATPR